VRIERGLVRGDWPEIADNEGYWDPFSAYYDSAYYDNETPPPYMALVRCGTDDESVKRFVECYGPIGKDLSHDGRKGEFNLEDFKLEQWRFRFALRLSKSLSSASLLRDAMLEDVEGARRNARRIERAHAAKNAPRPRSGAWNHAVLGIANAINVPQLDAKGNPQTFSDSWYREVCDKIKTTDHQGLVYRARQYLAAQFLDKLEPVRLQLGFTDSGTPSLIAECNDDLLVAFYWMLATDFGANRAPRMCANCKEFFFSMRADATYCKKEGCNERGRRLLDWERNKENYNRNRRLKRRREKQQRRRTRK
jgi:hypothetical protein